MGIFELDRQDNLARVELEGVGCEPDLRWLESRLVRPLAGRRRGRSRGDDQNDERAKHRSFRAGGGSVEA
jgi:hypothetical protein